MRSVVLRLLMLGQTQCSDKDREFDKRRLSARLPTQTN